MRVKVTISSPGHLFGEKFIVDVMQGDGRALAEGGYMPSLEEVAIIFLQRGVTVGGRWISPIRILEIEPVTEEKKIILREGENA